MTKRLLLFIFIMISIAFGMAFIPFHNSIRLDGEISDGEWKDAKEYDLTSGGKLMMKKEKNDLYVAMIAGKKAWAHLYFSHDDTVQVFHASAALGEARYVKQNDLWRTVQSFKWELRDKVYNGELVKKQQDHFHQYGWVSNNNNFGNGMIFEFRVNVNHTDNDPPTFACVVAEIL